MFEEFQSGSAQPHPPANDRIERFKTLWAMFQKGTAWINEEYKTHILPDGRRHFDPHLETQIKRFEDEVMKPMDLLWLEMSKEERDACGTLKLQPAEGPLKPAS